MPSIVPTPRGYGKCVDSDAHFFLCDYLEIDHRQPDPVKLGEMTAELHRSSISPTGKFGFHVTPYDGKLPMQVDWDSSWVSFFTKFLQGVYDLDTQINEPWRELADAMKPTMEIVIPRLLGPLEQNGRSVKPCLIHGDLWEANIGTNPLTEELYIFDSCAYYAHHEMEMGIWRTDHHNLTDQAYREEYFKRFKPDEPVEDYDDRNRLYSVAARLSYSAHVPGSEARVQALENLQYLIEKFVGH